MGLLDEPAVTDSVGGEADFVTDQVKPPARVPIAGAAVATIVGIAAGRIAPPGELASAAISNCAATLDAIKPAKAL